MALIMRGTPASLAARVPKSTGFDGHVMDDRRPETPIETQKRDKRMDLRASAAPASLERNWVKDQAGGFDPHDVLGFDAGRGHVHLIPCGSCGNSEVQAMRHEKPGNVDDV